MILRALSLALATSVATAAPAPDAAGYKKNVAPFLDKYCIDCHDDDTAKGKFSLDTLDPDLLNGDGHERWRLLRDQVHFRDMPPQKKPQPSDAERTAVLSWVRGELLKTQQPDVVTDEKLLLPKFGNTVDHEYLFNTRLPYTVPTKPRLWRLRPEIYDAVTPRLGENITGLANGLASPDGPGFKDYSAPGFLDEASTSPLLGNAKKVAAALVGDRSRDAALKALVTDDPPAADTVSKAVTAAFQKILGRQPTPEESDRFAAFHRESTTIGGHHAAALALVTAVLMQPEFFFRTELGDGNPDRHGRVRLTEREIAYALSYALDNRPIDEFFAAGLTDTETIATLLRERLRDDSRDYQKNPRILQFFREYFDYPNAKEIFKDQPGGGQHEPERLVDDLELTIIDILKADRDVLSRLLTTRTYYVNTKYGNKDKADTLVRRHEKRGKYHTAFNLPPDWRWSPHLQPVTFPADERAGVLTHPAWLAAWSGNFDNHPVQRGLWVRTHLLGGTVPDVPIGVDARVPEIEHTTFRNRLASATKPPECWRCHQSMDPLGLAFERFDHYGRYQRLDATQPVDPSAEISRTTVPELHQKFAGPIQMIEFLAKSEHVEQVFVRHVFRYFMGRNETLGDANTLQDAHTAYQNSNGSFNTLVISILTSDSFLLRAQPKSS